MSQNTHIKPARTLRRGACVLLMWTVLWAGGCEREDTFRAKLKAEGVRALEPASHNHSDAKIKLGQLLFFDPELSGNRDVSCATCHHPAHAMTDGRELSVGVGGKGLGPTRQAQPGREQAPRNSPALFNVNDSAWRVQFWDGRVELYASGEVRTPAVGSLPAGLDSVVAVQSMFPITSRDEMRGERGDTDIHGEPNELAKPFASNHPRIWSRITARVLKHKGYRDLLASAYPDLELDAIGFEHLANAMAAFEEEELALVQSPWDRYLRGDDRALSDNEMQGAKLFYGEAGCSTCHGGPLMTDQDFHNIAVPQFGPGKAPDKPLDLGRTRVSMDPADEFKFKTPSLRHVSYTAPYMHNGAYHSLEQAIAHHAAPAEMLRAYDGSALKDIGLKSSVVRDEAVLNRLIQGVSPKLQAVPDLTREQISALAAFLKACGDPELEHLERIIPERVPSGLIVD